MKEEMLNVPDMQSTHCQTRVRNLLEAISGIEIIAIESGKIDVKSNSELNIQEAIIAIEKAGYKVIK